MIGFVSSMWNVPRGKRCAARFLHISSWPFAPGLYSIHVEAGAEVCVCSGHILNLHFVQQRRDSGHRVLHAQTNR